MSQFSYNDYNNIVARAQNNSGDDEKRVGFFKLGENEIALARFNITSVDDLHFASIHKPIFGKKFENCGTGYSGISCLNPVGSYGENCPLCTAAAAGHAVVDKAKKVVFVPMLVAYFDNATGTIAETSAVIWERPAGFARELASKINDFGDLTKIVFKISRIGQGKDTRYLIDFVPTFNSTDKVSDDFSIFADLKINRHSYWEKSAEDMTKYLVEGKFPDIVKTTTPQTAPSIPQASTITAPQQLSAAPVPHDAYAYTTPVSVTPSVATAPVGPSTPTIDLPWNTTATINPTANNQAANPAESSSQATRAFNQFKF